MEAMEQICFQIISYTGEAKSDYIEAMAAARAYDFEKAERLMKEGETIFIEGHKTHGQLIQKEAVGENVQLSLLLMHAEDQLLGAETLRVVADEMIAVYRKLQAR